jgi:fatty-acyl-CoA synthase
MLGDPSAASSALSFHALRKLGGPAQRARAMALCQAIDADHIAAIRFTTAAPGQARGAVHSHHSLVNSAVHVARTLRLSGQDCVCVAASLQHGVGLVLGLLGCVASGATMLLPAVQTAEATLDALARHRATRLVARPTLIEALLEFPQRALFDLSGLRGGLIAGGRCPPELLRRAADGLHLQEALTSYGMTETNHIGLQPDLADALDRRAAYAGAVPPHMEAKVVDADGRIAPLGATGELCLRGYHLMRGYCSPDGAVQSATDPAGWLHSGDRAVMEQDGACRIVG